MKLWYTLLKYLFIGILIVFYIYNFTGSNVKEGFTTIVDEQQLVSGQNFKALCKYNLDDRYALVPYDDTLQEGDRVFLKVKDIPSFIASPPTKKVALVIANNDETFDDSLMAKIKPYVTTVYAVNSSAIGAIQIPMGFRDSQYTSNTVMYRIKEEASGERDILCLVNFLMATTDLLVTASESRGERRRALDAFTGKDWASISNEYINYDLGKSLNHSDEETKRRRIDYYKQLNRTKFVICPPGAGMDTHRIYECLFFGCIPIIKSSFLDPMYNRLGGCWIVGDWSDVTKEECERRWQSRKDTAPLLDINNWIDSDEGFQDIESKQKISFVSYGNSEFATARDRIGRQAKEMGIFNGAIQVYTPDDISEDFKKRAHAAFSQKRGGGYWTWKPYVVYDMLSKMNENDILVYADAGCILNKEAVGRLREYIDTISPQSDKSIFVMRLNSLREREWTVNAVFQYFGVDKNSDIYTSDQILATVGIYRKTNESMAFVKAWLDTAVSRPDLFTDQYTEDTKKDRSDFKETRHDQSIFSILIKSEPHKNYAVYVNDEVDDPDENAPIKAMRQRS
jgi:hypothetical protein